MSKFRTLAGAVAGTALALAAANAAFAADMTLKLAGVLPVEHYGHKMLEQIKADIEGAGVGLTVKYFPAGQLGSGEELLEDTIRGNIDIVHAFVYAHKDPVLEVNSLPFLVGSWTSSRASTGPRTRRTRRSWPKPWTVWASSSSAT